MEQAREEAGDSRRPHRDAALASYCAGKVPGYEILDGPPAPDSAPLP